MDIAGLPSKIDPTCRITPSEGEDLLGQLEKIINMQMVSDANINLLDTSIFYFVSCMKSVTQLMKYLIYLLFKSIYLSIHQSSYVPHRAPVYW